LCELLVYIGQTHVGLVSETEYPLKDSLGECSLPAYNRTRGVTIAGFTCERYRLLLRLQDYCLSNMNSVMYFLVF